jgi:hypothetical protein
MNQNDELARAIEEITNIFRLSEEYTFTEGPFNYSTIKQLIIAANRSIELEKDYVLLRRIIDRSNAEWSKQLSSQRDAMRVMVKALQRVWDGDECGWIVGSDGRRECVKCGVMDGEDHEDNCTQGFLYEALSLPAAQEFLK